MNREHKMLKHFTFTFIVVVILTSLTLAPSFAQRGLSTSDEFLSGEERRDRAAINDLLNLYEASFNDLDVDWRMSLCLETYQEYGFENGQFLQVRDYDETRRETVAFWGSIRSLEYSIDEIEITLDSSQAFVRAYTTHVTPSDNHSSIVYFSLVKINGVWRIAWDSYDIVRRYSDNPGLL